MQVDEDGNIIGDDDDVGINELVGSLIDPSLMEEEEEEEEAICDRWDESNLVRYLMYQEGSTYTTRGTTTRATVFDQ